MTPDPKRRARIRDPDLMGRLHRRPGECLLDDLGQCTSRRVGLHHILPRGNPRASGDDVEDNLVWLCGHGTAGCHGLVSKRDREACAAVGERLTPANVAYVLERLGETEGRAFLWNTYRYKGG